MAATTERMHNGKSSSDGVISSSTSKKLPFHNIDNIPIRYLWFTENKFENDKTHEVPLFLGADVLAGSSQLEKNYARTHARYCKDGFAVRLKFNGAKIIGIPNSSSVWFYTIQGLFRVAFEMLDAAAQRDCLVQLTDLWMQYYPGDKLPDSASVNMVVETSTGQCFVSPVDHEDGIRLTTTNSESFKMSKHSTTCLSFEERSVSSDDMQSSINQSNDISHLNVSESTSHSDCTSCAVSEEENSIPVAYNCVVDTSSTCIPNVTKGKFGRQDIYSTCNVTCEQATDDVLTYLEACLQNNSTLYSDENFILLLELIKMLDANCQESDDENVHDDILITVLSKIIKIRNDESLQHFYENDFDLSVKTNITICVLSDWMGQEFNQMETVIAEKVVKFKQEHIHCIDNLPSPEFIVNHLFPQCMRDFVFNWIGCHGDENMADHNYSPKAKRTKIGRESLFTKDACLYPIVQLILEFANNSLVSGVAHVVYSRLRHA